MSISIKASAWGRILAAFGAAFLLACSEAAPPSDQKLPAEPQASARISAQAGRYEMDRNHSRLQFRVGHLGLSNYVVRFNKFDMALTLDPDNPSASSVTVIVDPTSVDTDYPGDYKEAIRILRSRVLTKTWRRVPSSSTPRSIRRSRSNPPRWNRLHQASCV